LKPPSERSRGGGKGGLPSLSGLLSRGDGGGATLERFVKVEDLGLAFEFFTASFIPLAGHGEDLARSGKAADLLVKAHHAEQAAFSSSVLFFPSTGPVLLGAFEPGEFGKGQLMKGGLVVFEPGEVACSQDQQDDCPFFCSGGRRVSRQLR
jgi:hypothetical protein